MTSLEKKLEVLLNFGLILVVLVSPLLVLSNSFGYEQIKVAFFLITLTICAILWLILSLKEKNFKLDKLRISGGIFILCLFISSVFGVNPWVSLIGRPPYLQGFVFYLYLYLFFLMVSYQKISLKYWILVFSGASTLVSLIAIQQFLMVNLFNMSLPTYAGRVISTFGQPNFYSGFILFCMPFIYLVITKMKGYLRLFGVLSLVVGLLGIFMSLSRASILIVCGLFLFWLLHRFIKIKVLITGVSLILLFAVFVSLTFSSGIFWEEVVKPLSTKNPIPKEQSLEKRVYIWPVILELISKKPILGYGLENMGETFAQYKPKEELKASSLYYINQLVVDRSHNMFLDLLFFSGVLGLGTFLFFITQLLHQIEHGVAFAFLLTFLIWMQFQNPSVVHLIFFWGVAGLIVQHHRGESLDKAFN